MNKVIKVVAINTPYQIVLNAGKEDGLQIGDKFIIFGVGEMIKDPDSGEDLERLEIPRGKGKVIYLQNKICTIESIEVSETPTTIKKTNRISSAFAASLLYGYPDTEESQIKREKMPFNDIQIGDYAKKV